jgi:hypothetical protein
LFKLLTDLKYSITREIIKMAMNLKYCEITLKGDQGGCKSNNSFQEKNKKKVLFDEICRK